MQFLWFKKAYDLKQRQFNQTVYLALQNVADQILEYQKVQVPLMGLVNQISTNYYAVNINAEIETSVLEFLLKTEFQKRNISVDFEYGVYNCESGKMVYGNYISIKNRYVSVKKSDLPVWEKNKYYFTVLFPEITVYLTSQMGIWLFFNGVLLVICLFFSYALVIILRQKRLSEIQKDFINNMTHEFKTPISTIMVSVDLLKKPEIIQNSELVLNYSDIILHETMRLKGQVDKVLQIALLDKGKLNYNFQNVEMHHVIHEMTKSAKLLIAEKNGKINLHLEAINPIIKADAVHVMNVLHNLIDNALKYCQTNPVITIHTENLKKFLIISIKDNGIGISKEHRKRIFDKFFRVPTGNVHNVKGFGLGLYYVKTVVNGHYGKLELNSEIDHGSEIKIYLPSAI